MTATTLPPSPPSPGVAVPAAPPAPGIATERGARDAGSLAGFWRAVATVARRDFVAVVVTPAFLLFLAAPLLMIGFSMLSGKSGAALAKSQTDKERLLVVATADDAVWLRQADARLRLATRRPPPLVIEVVRPADQQAAAARAIAAIAHATAGASADADRRGGGGDGPGNKAGGIDHRDTLAVWTGTLDRPVIHEKAARSASGDWLALVGDDARRARTLAGAAGAGSAASGAATIDPAPARIALGSGNDLSRLRGLLGYIAVFVLFMLTLLLASQAIGMLAEEKSNKVIEILAAAVPLEAVFIGKLVGLIGVAILYVGTWALLLTVAGMALGVFAIGSGGAAAAATAAATSVGGQGGAMAGGAMGGLDGAAIAAGLSALAPAIGWPGFLGLGVVYFIMSFLIFGGLFLAIGSLASSARDIQMLSLPVIVIEMAMFLLASAGANDPGSRIATIAAIVPLSSPYAMAARGASDAAWWPHALAIGWQLLWVVIVVRLGVRMFRVGVLGNGWNAALPRWMTRRARRPAAS